MHNCGCICWHLFVDICAPGSYSTTGLSPCTLCPVNTYQSSQRRTLCIDCPPRTVTTFSGSTNCTGKDITYLMKCFTIYCLFIAEVREIYVMNCAIRMFNRKLSPLSLQVLRSPQMMSAMMDLQVLAP